MAVTDLTGTKWLLNSKLADPSFVPCYINFVYNGISCRYLNKSSYYGGFDLIYGHNDGQAYYVYKGDSGGWLDESYRTIEINGGQDVANAQLISWLTANATQIIEATPTTITYNGTELASLEEGQTATFPQGVKAKTDVSIVFGSKGSITYKGVTTEIEKGKTANLLCAGKKFATDVVVAVEKAEESIVGTWVFNDFSTVEIPPLQRINLSCEGTFIGLDEKGNVTEISLTTIRIRIADANATGATYTYNFGLVGVPMSDANCDSQTRINFEGNESAYSLHTFGSSTRNTAMMAYTEKYGVYTANEITTFTVTNIDQSQENYHLVLSWLKANATKQS